MHIQFCEGLKCLFTRLIYKGILHWCVQFSDVSELVNSSSSPPLSPSRLSAALSSPLQILAAQASSSPPVLVSRQPSAGADGQAEQPGEPQAKRPKMEEEEGPGSAQPPVTPAQQPVIVAMMSQPHDPRK